MKIKVDKTKIDYTEQAIAPEEMSNIEKESLRLTEVATATQTEMSVFYTQMLQLITMKAVRSILQRG